MDLTQNQKSNLENQVKSGHPNQKNTEKKDYTINTIGNQRQEGKYQIRFVPSKLNKDKPISRNVSCIMGLDLNFQ